MVTFGNIVMAVTATAAALLLSAPAAARPVSIRTLAAHELRLATIAYRIATANAAVCPTREAVTGMVVHDLTRYHRSVRPAVSSAFSMSNGFGILEIVPNSVAAQAGLRVDDEILAVGRYGVTNPGAWGAAQSYQRMEQFQAIVRAALKGGNTELLIRRRGAVLRVPLRAQYGCGGLLTLKNSSSLNAWSDGKHVLITTGMNTLSQSEDEIAFVIAHEMAHNILGHSGDGAGPRGIFGFARVRRGEVEADGYAVQLMTTAGYEPAGGIAFLENAQRRLWWSVSLDHPGFGQRLAIVAAAIRATRRNSIHTIAMTEQPTPARSALKPGVPASTRF
jgi:Peptidase family M48